MNYNEALRYIHGTRKLGWKLGLKNITRLLSLMGNPHKKLKFIHIAGTNGKGSTAAFINSILVQAGYKTGVFTSPYLERFTERIKLGHDEISEDDVASITCLVKEKVEEMIASGCNHPSEFEIVTAVAMQYFYENKCDVVVLEVGLGGESDSTNVIDTPLLSVITSISYDHMEYLGSTLEEIAMQKAGIIKQGGDVVLYPQQEDVERLMERICTQRKARLHKVDFNGIRLLESGIEGQVFDYGEHKSIRISLLGEHQIRNAALAVRCIELLKEKGFNITESAMKQGLQAASWPGRLQIVNTDPLFVIDGAHNAEGAKVLRKALDNYFPGRRKIIILGVLKDKDYKSMIEEVVPAAHQVIAVTPSSERGLPAKELAILVKPYCKNVLINDTIEEAIRTSLRLSSSNDMICAFGSLYYIGEVNKFFKNYNA
jgi:dihydrofolate synthase/folylpolyglutamate synthase